MICRHERASLFAILFISLFASCKKDDHAPPEKLATSITVENVLNSKPLVESGTFQDTGETPLIFPGKSISIHFSAAKGEALAFATMYGWSNDLFFAPENPGIQVYDEEGKPIEGDVSWQIKLWDNGSRVNQVPGADVTRPGTAENKAIMEVKGEDEQHNTYLEAAKLMQVTLHYDGNSFFTLTITNISGGTTNETPFSPGVWAVSYIAGGNLLNPAPLYTPGEPTTAGLTALSEAGNNGPISEYVKSLTGIFTPLSPVLVVVYNGIDNPIYKTGEKDRGEGLKELAQKGNADILAAALMNKQGVKQVYVLPAPDTKVLLPKIDGKNGGIVSHDIEVENGDRLAIATMYGFSNDWFFATAGDGIKPVAGDISATTRLYNNGTAIDQFPGAGITQFNLAGTPLEESEVIMPVPNPNPFTTLPEITEIIKVTLK